MGKQEKNKVKIALIKLQALCTIYFNQYVKDKTSSSFTNIETCLSDFILYLKSDVHKDISFIDWINNSNNKKNIY